MAADGSIVISMGLDNKEAMRELRKTEKEINKINESLNEKRERRSALDDEAQEIGLAVDDTRRKVEDLREELEEVNNTLEPKDMHTFTATAEQFIDAQARQAELTQELQEQEKELAKQETAADRAHAAWEKADQAVQKEEAALTAATERAGELSRVLAATAEEAEMAARAEEGAADAVGNLDAELEDVSESAEEAGDEGEEAGHRISEAMQLATKKVDKIGRRLTGMIRRVFFFSVITMALRGVREYFSSILNMSPEFSRALGQLKSAFLTLAQPIVERLIPALTSLLQIVTQIVTALAALVSRIFGTTFAESQAAAKGLYEQAEAYKATGSAAKKASRQLAAFDQLNILNENQNGGSTTDANPLFDLEANEDEQGNKLNRLLKIIQAIGAALLAWKIGSTFGLGLKEILGLALLLYSTFEFIGDFLRTWDEGITWDNLGQLLLDILGMAAGAYLAFGKIGAGIALVLGGLALLALAFHDMIENGMSLENVLTAVAGLLLTGLGLSILTGSFIPLALAALGSLLLMLVYLFGEGEEFTAGMQKIFGGLGQFFKSIFAGDVEGAIAGLKLAFEGLKQVSVSVARAVQKAWQTLCDWVGQKLGPEWKAFFERIGGYFGAWINNLKLGLKGIITFITGIFTGDLELAMQGVRDVAIAIGNSLLEFMAIITNGIIDAINLLIGGLNSIVGDIPDWVELFGLVIPGLPHLLVSLKKFQTIPNWTPPRLAQGAVIPPNREFMAVLGDQKSGTNIEAPLDTIVAAFRQALSDGGIGDGVVNLYLDGDKIASSTIKRMNRAARAGGRLGVV